MCDSVLLCVWSVVVYMCALLCVPMCVCALPHAHACECVRACARARLCVRVCACNLQFSLDVFIFARCHHPRHHADAWAGERGLAVLPLSSPANEWCRCDTQPQRGNGRVKTLAARPYDLEMVRDGAARWGQVFVSNTTRSRYLVPTSRCFWKSLFLSQIRRF